MLCRKYRLNRYVCVGVLLNIVVILVLTSPLIAKVNNSLTVKVQSIIDGDTIKVRYKGQPFLVRLWGIDTPEYHQAFSKVAKKYTTKLVKNSSVQLEEKGWDKYGRMVAIVTLEDGRCLNEELLKAGYSWVHIYYCREAICDKWKEYEKDARRQRIGLWRDNAPIPPWVYKRNRMKKKW